MRLAGQADFAAVNAVLVKFQVPGVIQITMQKPHQPCRRLFGSGCLPERAGQPTQIVLHLDLERLRGLPGAPEAEAAWAGQATAGPGDDCDAQIVPVVTGRVDPGVLDRVAAALLHGTPPGPGRSRHPSRFRPRHSRPAHHPRPARHPRLSR